MKNFEDFRDNWLTDAKINELKKASLNQTKELKNNNVESFMATFSATYALLMLAEYHEWLNR